jgi:hypothetical protein
VEGTVVGAAPGVSLYSGEVLEGGSVLVRILMGMAWLIDCGVIKLILSRILLSNKSSCFSFLVLRRY